MDPALKTAIDDILARAKADAPTVVPVLVSILKALEAATPDPVAKAVIAALIVVLQALVPNPPAPGH